MLDLCPVCAGPIDQETGECIENRELWEAIAKRMAEALDRAQEQITNAS